MGGLAKSIPRREGSVVRSASCDGSAARYASIDVELYRVPVILMNDESSVGGREEPIELARSLRNSGIG